MFTGSGRSYSGTISLEEFLAVLSAEAGDEYADVLTTVCREVFDGRNESFGDSVQQALGRARRRFADYCRRTAATGVWNVPVGTSA